MGRNEQFEGVYAREASILISFQWNGGGEGPSRRFRERIALLPTLPNLRAAARLRDDIQAAIRLGRFTVENFASHFPDSKWLKQQPTRTGDTFKDVRLSWLRLAESELQATTYSEYRRTLDRYFTNVWEDREIASITFDELSEYLAGQGIKSPKTFNNVMTPLRRLFAHAVLTKKITEDITEGISSRKVQLAAPDPLDIEEIEAVLAHISEKYAEPWLNYFEVAFFTGMRPSEQIALQWKTVDFRSHKARIEAARVRSVDKGTKTHKVRDIDLQTRAFEAITRQKKFTFLNAESGFMFHNPYNDQRFFNTDPPLSIVWHPTLKALGIRDRDARQTRHSFATMCLHAGMNPAYVAKQMGNSPRMFFDVYSRWIDGDASQREKAKLDALLSHAPKKQAL
nr:Putative defective protein IntQ [Paraburkholderia busanensis]